MDAGRQGHRGRAAWSGCCAPMARRGDGHLQSPYADRRPPADRRSGCHHRCGVLCRPARPAPGRCASDCSTAPFYRLIHAEADGLPGLVMDRFGELLVVQINTRRHGEALARDLDGARSGAGARSRSCCAAIRRRARLEGLSAYVKMAKGELEGPIELDGERASLPRRCARSGQKTGWFYRPARQPRRRGEAGRGRARARSLLLCRRLRSGRGRRRARAVVAASTARSRRWRWRKTGRRVERACRSLPLPQGRSLRGAGAAGARPANASSMVIADPPAFVKSKKDLNQGARAYRKLARLCGLAGQARRASCSSPPARTTCRWRSSSARSIAGWSMPAREGRILRAAGAASDHPLHPALPESAYLKSLLLQLD